MVTMAGEEQTFQRKEPAQKVRNWYPKVAIGPHDCPDVTKAREDGKKEHRKNEQILGYNLEGSRRGWGVSQILFPQPVWRRGDRRRKSTSGEAPVEGTKNWSFLQKLTENSKRCQEKAKKWNPEDRLMARDKIGLVIQRIWEMKKRRNCL